MALVLLAWAGWLILLDPRDDLECPFCTQYLAATIPVFRILLVPIIGIWSWAVGVRVWEKHNVNYSVSALKRPLSLTRYYCCMG